MTSYKAIQVKNFGQNLKNKFRRKKRQKFVPKMPLTYKSGLIGYKATYLIFGDKLVLFFRFFEGAGASIPPTMSNPADLGVARTAHKAIRPNKCVTL